VTALSPAGLSEHQAYLGISSHQHHVFTSSFIPSPVNMAPAVRRPTGQAVQAEVSLSQSLKNCLVNLPSSLVSVLVNANTVRMKHSHDAW
jgi:hypothetical protein